MTGLTALAGMTVVPNTNADVIGNLTISAQGGLSVSFGTPSLDEMERLTPITAQALTGIFGNGDGSRDGTTKEGDSRFLDKDYRIHREDLNAGHSNLWSTNNRQGRLGIPVVFPDNLYTQGGNDGYPYFLMLELRVENSAGDWQGNLERWGRSKYRTGDFIEEVKVVRWIYVDRDCAVYRAEDGHAYTSPMRYVFLNLKRGWNQIEAKEHYSWSNDVDGLPATPAAASLGFIYLTVSNGRMADHGDGIGDRETNTQAQGSSLKSIDVPWSLRTDNAFGDIMSQPLQGGVRPESMHQGNYRSTWRSN